MRANALEQLFLRPKAGGLELLLVLESEAGDRQRVTLQPPRAAASGAAAGGEAGKGGSAAELMAVDHVARWLVRHGNSLAPRLRVRRERGSALTDAPALRDLLRSAVRRLERLEDEERQWE